MMCFHVLLHRGKVSTLEILSIFINLFAALGTVVASWAAIRALRIQTSPDILMYVRPDDNSDSNLRLVIRNNGDAPAYDVKFRLDRSLFPEGDSFEYDAAEVVFSSGYAILPPMAERTILLGYFGDIEPLWGRTVYEVSVEYKTRWKARRRRTACPVEIGSFRSEITIDRETQIEKDAKRALRSVPNIERSLKSIAKSLADGSRS